MDGVIERRETDEISTEYLFFFFLLLLLFLFLSLSFHLFPLIEFSIERACPSGGEEEEGQMEIAKKKKVYSPWNSGIDGVMVGGGGGKENLWPSSSHFPPRYCRGRRQSRHFYSSVTTTREEMKGEDGEKRKRNHSEERERHCVYYLATNVAAMALVKRREGKDNVSFCFSFPFSLSSFSCDASEFSPPFLIRLLLLLFSLSRKREKGREGEEKGFYKGETAQSVPLLLSPSMPTKPSVEFNKDLKGQKRPFFVLC